MQQKAEELNKLMGAKDNPGVTKFVKKLIKNEEPQALKRVFIIARSMHGNVVEYSINNNAHTLFDLLIENKQFIPRRFFDSAGCKYSNLIHYAVDKKNTYVVRNLRHLIQTAQDAVALLYIALENKDIFMTRLLLNHWIGKDSDLPSLRIPSALPVSPPPNLSFFKNQLSAQILADHIRVIKEEVLEYSKHQGDSFLRIQKNIVKQFHDNLFSFYSASRWDPDSKIYDMPTDCIRHIHELGF